MSDSVRLERDGPIARLTLNRPEAGNAIDLELAHELAEKAAACADDAAIRCVVLTGTGRFFCVGGDVKLFATATGDELADLLRELAGTVALAVSRFSRMDKPLLVAVNGPAAGAGFSLAMAGDIVLASETAQFTAGYSAIGLAPDAGLTWQLPRLVGLRRSQEILLTNRRVGAVEAERIGLVTRITGDGELDSETNAMARSLAHGPTAAFAATRALLLHNSLRSYEEQMADETKAIGAAGARPEGQEGIAAFVAKRTPRFEGKQR
ncbi:enoyl-CoA hydratase-related protein [Sphingosinicella ginsenosidimutans]|uniref:Enoyl-CoA hydratase n=1 Tax=Allosphingosinicella ginsenosidimutans TaxID=1176539 RepID=A0A5C6TWC1_9SPHN|nr:enoyl-CoA hydratase-related protein [Sphingosinicella ginsenosidimutans]TXC64018.1 enoyl-CoA hydratase [Sphingosinicella ginsenosidimutans]